MRTQLRLDQSRTALLLVDIQEEQRQSPLYSVAGFARVLANARTLLLAARNHGIHVVHATYRRDFSLTPPRPFEPVDTAGRPAFSDVADPLVAICEELAPAQSEKVIHKEDASAFSEGSLH